MCHNPNMATQQNEAVLKESKQNVATTTREAVVEAEGRVRRSMGEVMEGRGREESSRGIKSTQIRIYCSMFLAFCKIKFASDLSRGRPGSRGREVYRSPRS